jgi:hypothetical protein
VGDRQQRHAAAPGGVFANEAYAAGRVAIPIKPPAVCPADPIPQASTARVPTQADRLWTVGYELGRQGIDGKACAERPESSRVAFDDGLASGKQSRMADMDHALKADTCGSQEWDDEGDYLDPAERAEAGMFPSRPIALD